MNSRSTVPSFSDADQLQFLQEVQGGQHPSTYVLYGAPASRWRERALAAMQALQANPNDVGAQRTLDSARMVLREHAYNLGEQANAANLADQEQARQRSGLFSTIAGATQGVTAGFGDEIAGLATAIPRMMPGGESPGQAYLRGRDQARAVNAQAMASHPYLYSGAELAGGAVPATLAGGAVSAAAPGLMPAIRAAATPGAGLGARAAGAAASGVLTAPIAALFGYGAGEQGPVSDLGSAGESAVGGALLGGVLGGLGTTLARRTSVRAANEAETVARLGTEQARRVFYEQRAQQIAAQRSEGIPAGMDPAEYAIRNSPMLRGMPQAEQDAVIARMRSTVGNPLYRAPEASGTPPVQAPSTQRTAPPAPSRAEQVVEQAARAPEVDAAISEGRAIQAAREAQPAPTGPVETPSFIAPNGGTPITSPREAARAAHTLVMNATGDAQQALAAGRKAAAFAQQAVPAASPPNILAILSEGPTEAHRASVLNLLQQSTPAQQRLIASQLEGNPAWRAWLRQAGVIQ